MMKVICIGNRGTYIRVSETMTCKDLGFYENQQSMPCILAKIHALPSRTYVMHLIKLSYLRILISDQPL